MGQLYFLKLLTVKFIERLDLWFLEVGVGEEELEEGDRKVQTSRYYKKNKKNYNF